jgi:hypothetical protein
MIARMVVRRPVRCSCCIWNIAVFACEERSWRKSGRRGELVNSQREVVLC